MNILITLGSQTVIVSLTTRHTFFIHICLVIVVIVYKHESERMNFIVRFLFLLNQQKMKN